MILASFSSAPQIEANAATSLPNSIFIQQGYSGTCTLAAATMMLRARMYLSGNSAWSSITENSLLPVAWINGTGLRHSFTYNINGNSMSVAHSLTSGISISSLKSLLNNHPEGIVLYCGNLPHAVFVTDYEGDTFYCADSAGGNYSGNRRTLASSLLGNYYEWSQTKILANTTAYWYVSSYSIKSTGMSVNLGTDFYAYIINTSSWKHLTNINGNVVISAETGKANQVWKFDLQNDGSYKITNCADGLIMEDVNFGTTNGSNVAVYGNNDSSAQRWYITGESGAYEFRAQCGNLVMDVDNGSSGDGTNVQMWERNNTAAQKFQVWKLNKPGSTYVQCVSGSTYKPTVIQWNATSDTKCYDIKIWNGTYWQGDAYKTIWGVTGTSCDVDLPPGYYEAYVDSRNNFSATMSSNIIKFTVVDTAEPVNIGNNVYGSLLVNEPWINVTNVGNDVKLQDDDNYSLHHVIWNFKRQSDGTYVIYSCADNKVLTVDASNKNVYVKEYDNSDSQKWYIYGRWSGEYYFKPKNSSYVLSVEEDGYELGNNVCISKLNYASDQKYAIYEVDPSVLETTKPTEKPTEIKIARGDTDLDGEVSVLDAAKIQMYLVGKMELLGDALLAADVDLDGEISVLDASKIQMFLVGRFESL